MIIVLCCLLLQVCCVLGHLEMKDILQHYVCSCKKSNIESDKLPICRDTEFNEKVIGTFCLQCVSAAHTLTHRKYDCLFISIIGGFCQNST